MNCSRCSGLMVEDHFLDFEGTTGYMWMTGFRCMNCGHVYDPVIEQNRQAQRDKVLVLPSGEPDYHDEEVHLGAESIIARAA
jgi:uncharacterized Zn finger protein